ncbi:MAG: DinB family protein [Marmoricola sp.]
MAETIKDELHHSLRRSRDAVLWKLDGLSEYDVRRPLTPTGTNLLGLVKHLAIGEAWYFGDVFGRPFLPHLPWWDDGAEEGTDFWATPGESREGIVATYRATIAHADETIGALDLDATGHVPWWSRPAVTLHRILVHLATETARHAGHADILREQLDGEAGLAPGNANHDPHDARWWVDRRARIENDARRAAQSKQ